MLDPLGLQTARSYHLNRHPMRAYRSRQRVDLPREADHLVPWMRQAFQRERRYLTTMAGQISGQRMLPHCQVVHQMHQQSHAAHPWYRCLGVEVSATMKTVVWYWTLGSVRK